MAASTSSNNELNEYEKAILIRKEQNLAKIRSLFPDGASLMAIKPKQPRKRSKREKPRREGPPRRNPKRKARHDNGDHNDNNDSDEQPLIVNLWPALLSRNKDRKRKPTARRAVPRSPVKITEADLILVAATSSEKHYDQENGTTCHQCRQKTDDFKTTCKSKACFGVRGQFCGPCLRTRYGEDAKVAIMNDKWICPPCRGECNCSFCMKKKGKRATGIMIHIAKQKGFESVKDYLASQ